MIDKVEGMDCLVSPKMTFGEAIEALKQGKRVARKGWNGKGINLVLVPAGTIRIGHYNEAYDQEISRFIAIDTTGLKTDNPYAPKSIVPWLASQTDMLAEDWMMVD